MVFLFCLSSGVFVLLFFTMPTAPLPWQVVENSQLLNRGKGNSYILFIGSVCCLQYVRLSKVHFHSSSTE